MAFWDGAGSAILSGAASLFGGLLGYDSNESANQTNLQIARETNEQNYKMFHEQQDWNEMMWNKMNAYNTPMMQKERLRAAGINPYAMLGSNGQGTMGQAGLASSASPAPAQGATVQPYDWSPSMAGVGRAIDSWYQNQNQDAQTTLLRIQAITQLDRDLANLEESWSRVNLNRANKDLSEEQRNNYKLQSDELLERIDILKKTKQDQIDLLHGNVAYQKYQISEQEQKAKIAEYQAEYQKMFNDTFKDRSDAEIEQMRAAAASAWSTVKLNSQMSEESKARTAREVTEKQIAEIRKKQLPVTHKEEIRMMKANRRYVDAMTSKTMKMNNWVQNYSPLASLSGGAAMLKVVK